MFFLFYIIPFAFTFFQRLVWSLLFNLNINFSTSFSFSTEGNLFLISRSNTYLFSVLLSLYIFFCEIIVSFHPCNSVSFYILPFCDHLPYLLCWWTCSFFTMILGCDVRKWILFVVGPSGFMGFQCIILYWKMCSSFFHFAFL